jgi:gamma-butyrobetaine dioxygenase
VPELRRVGRKALEVVFDGAPPLAIHPLWLRERCRDPGACDPVTEQRLYNPGELESGITVADMIEAAPGVLDITFTDGYGGRFLADDILAEVAEAEHGRLPRPIAWSATDEVPGTADWRAHGDDHVRMDWLQQYLTGGYIIFSHVPTQPGSVLAVARVFGFPRETNFGALFDVRSMPDASDLAYTGLALDPHTDNPYRTPVPGIQLLHCLVNQTPGGLSTLVDGLAVAEALRVEDADAFDVLARLAVRFRYIDATTELVAHASIIELDLQGHFQAINYSPRLDFVPLLQPAMLDRFFAARRSLDALLKSDRFERRFRLGEGELMMFDNRRLLHGRTRFDPSAGLRHLQGCYIDADGPSSQYRTLRRCLG